MVLHVGTPGARVRYENRHLWVAVPGEEKEVRVPLAEIERAGFAAGVQVSCWVLAELMRAGVPVHFMEGSGRLLGILDGPMTKDGELRRQQYARSMDEGFCLGMAKKTVAAKVQNQMRLLQRLEGNRPGRVEGRAMEMLAQGKRRVEEAGSAEELRGIEGNATKVYFGEWAKFFPPEFPFEERSTRPPKNPVNAVVSFGSAVLYNLIVGILQKRGLDAAIGFFHVTDNRRYALALDLVEAFRPAVSEAFAVRMFGHRILGEESFEPMGGGVYLNRCGRSKFLFHWEKRMRRSFVPPGHEVRSTMEQELETRVVNYKRALAVPEEFAPFLMP